jgi:DNA invertase Pin-like site-specific DNA recombinase
MSAGRREELQKVLHSLRCGDVLVVTRIDRLACNILDLQDIVCTIEAEGASLKVTDERIDTDTPAGRCFLNMLRLFAEFERNLWRERQLVGIAKAKAAGVYTRRPGAIDAEQVLKLKAHGLGTTAIAKTLKISRASVKRLVRRAQLKNGSSSLSSGAELLSATATEQSRPSEP